MKTQIRHTRGFNVTSFQIWVPQLLSWRVSMIKVWTCKVMSQLKWHVVGCETVTKHQVVQQVIRCQARNPRKFSCIWNHLGIHAEFRKKSTGYNEANRCSKSGTTCPLFPLTEWSALAEKQLHSLLNAFRWGVREQDLNQSTHPSCHFHCSYIILCRMDVTQTLHIMHMVWWLHYSYAKCGGWNIMCHRLSHHFCRPRPM